MSARIRRRQHEIAIQFFGRIHVHENGLAVIHQDAATIVIEHELGINQFAVILEQPVDAVRSPAFFIRRHGKNDVAARHVTFLFHSNQSGRHDGVTVLHVAGAASVEVALLFDKLERIGRPVFTPGFDHVEMPDQQHGFVLARSMQTHDNILLAIVRAKHLDIAIREPTVAESLRHRLRRCRDAAHRVCSVDLDELLEDVVR